MNKLFLILFLITTAAYAQNFGTYGQTFPIVEENLIEYFTRKLPRPDFAQMQKSAETPQPAGITSTKTERTFLFDPTYTLDEDITNDGQVLHKAGTKINPLDYVSWGSEMILIDGDDDKQIAWVKSRAGEMKVVLVKGSPAKLEEQLGINVYFDQSGQITKQLGIKQVPATVAQEGKILKIMEVKV